MRRVSPAPVVTVRRQGWMLEFEGLCWARARAERMRSKDGTGVLRNFRVE